MDHNDFAIGGAQLDNMERAVEQCRHTLLILSADWLNSEFAQFGSFLAATSDPAGRRRRVLPLLLKKCTLPKRIGFLTGLDFTDLSRCAAEMRRLVRALTSHEDVQKVLPLHNDQAGLPPAKAWWLCARLPRMPM